MAKKVVILTLQTFSATGGIQKMARTLAHSLQFICRKYSWKLKLLSLYDSDDDLLPQYISPDNFKGYNKSKSRFIWSTLWHVRNGDLLILTHINFAVVGIIAKILHPGCQIWLIAHGIEVWRPLKFQKKKLLKYCDKIVCVSQFTKDKIINLHRADANKCVVLNNAVDPFIMIPTILEKPQHLLSRYGFTRDNQVIFTLTRLASTEKYKGYENVIHAIGKLKQEFPAIRYVLSGKYDALEKARVKALINQYDVTDHVLLTGFIDDSELGDHFLLADLFVLPSKKEGFGIVFIEAMACGLPVICGNVDGSIDAIRNGELGKAINPDDQDALQSEIIKYFLNPLSSDKRSYLQKKSLQYFSEESYIGHLETLLKQAAGS